MTWTSFFTFIHPPSLPNSISTYIINTSYIRCLIVWIFFSFNHYYYQMFWTKGWMIINQLNVLLELLSLSWFMIIKLSTQNFWIYNICFKKNISHLFKSRLRAIENREMSFITCYKTILFHLLKSFMFDYKRSI